MYEHARLNFIRRHPRVSLADSWYANYPVLYTRHKTLNEPSSGFAAHTHSPPFLAHSTCFFLFPTLLSFIFPRFCT
ncbi:hypothetical protein METBIDRAFT_219775 [Metschnikowia bicuspidata var. bicuspidata NRRL YB-4993]|uniref:Uncharacterized protein n=1 Tax=Metschnikowia bicuspidata var. bicuspidata NRRL YB-4993 TaxID=869754 RepID=A0A1A0H509_9ASCO|nr:hypothetical protein METBIDRAFT_219775 [Metschnikowia bicuspidata var. bicuspidata NRRL YB-4993]OBA19164.1 hypothetical protein METBIDRAFT_219775 [Metschnikowia bicuspidata var. bicuspidata NRRL YB-4993]